MKNENENEKIFVKQFVITDDLGKVHRCVLAGVLVTETSKEFKRDISTPVTNKYDVTSVTVKSWEEVTVTKNLSFGLAITNPTDSFDFEVGKMIAIGRAKKQNKKLGELTTTNKSMLGPDMTNMLMDQQVAYISSNIGKFVKAKIKEVTSFPVSSEEAVITRISSEPPKQ